MPRPLDLPERPVARVKLVCSPTGHGIAVSLQLLSKTIQGGPVFLDRAAPLW